MTRAVLDEYIAGRPAFTRVRSRDEPPPIICRVAGYEFGRFGGIPVVHKGYATVVYKYRIDLLCDVCGKPVEYKKIHLGAPAEVPRTEAEKMMAGEKKLKRAVAAGKEVEAPARDKELV